MHDFFILYFILIIVHYDLNTQVLDHHPWLIHIKHQRTWVQLATFHIQIDSLKR